MDVNRSFLRLRCLFLIIQLSTVKYLLYSVNGGAIILRRLHFRLERGLAWRKVSCPSARAFFKVREVQAINGTRCIHVICTTCMGRKGSH